ncbi:MAG: hypothetical protein RSG79_19645 [Pseudomonas sp.]
MHPSIQTRRDILSVLKERSVIATAEFYEKVGRVMPVILFRLQVKPAGRDFFHVVDDQTGKVLGFRRDHNEACALARRLEKEKRS